MREGWEYKKLGEICTIERGGSPRPISAYITDAENGVNWIKIGDAVEGSKYISSTKEKIKPEGVKKSRFVHKGDFILSNSMSFGKPYILDVDGCIHDGWLVLHDNENRFIKDYLYYILSSNVMYLKFKSLAVGGVVNNLNSDLVKNVSIPVPPLSVQQTIVSELDTLSAIIAKYKEQLADYDKLEQSIFYDMFGDPVKNEKGWEVKKLGENVYEMFLGPFGSALKTECYVDEDKSYAMVYEQKHAIKGSLNQENHFIDENKFKSLKRFEVLPGDFIMSCRGTIGKIYQIPNNAPRGIIHPSLMKIRIKNVYISIFFRYLLEKVIASTNTNGNCVQMAITASNLAKLLFILPPYTFQQSFASKIESIEAIKAETKLALEEAELLFNARMDYYFND